MKRILLCLTILLFLTGCTSNKKTKSYIEIDYTKYQHKLENKEEFALYIGSADCIHCQELKPTLEKIITKYDLEMYYIDLSKLDRTQYNDIWNTSNLTGTPTIVFVSEGNIKLFPRIVGAVSENVLVEKLETAGYIR